MLAVSDGVRYASKKAGYHGGASLAEITIPILVAKPRGADDPAGWVEAPPQEPTWWNEPSRVAVETPPLAAERPTKAKARTPVSPTAPTLFDTEPMKSTTVEVAAGASVGDQLIASPTYGVRRSIAGRHPVEDGVAVAVISALILGGGRAHRDTLAVAAGVPSETMSGFLAALRRVLNVDGYQVIDVDADQVTVVLDVALLREQFELGAGL